MYLETCNKTTYVTVINSWNVCNVIHTDNIMIHNNEPHNQTAAGRVSDSDLSSGRKQK